MDARRSDVEAPPRELVVTRVLDAPRSLVFQAWTDPRHVVHWWMPKGFAAPDVETMDVRVGGSWRIRMPSLDGKGCTAYGVYREVVKDQRLAWDDFCDDADGNFFHKAFVIVTFEEHGTATKVTLRARLEGVPGRDPRWTMEFMEQGWVGGWKDNLELLAGYVAQLASTADREIVLTRTYEAPRSLIFKVWTDVRHVTQWWGPRGFTTTTHSMDVRPGGAWRYTMHGPDGVDYPNLATYLEVVPPERLVYDHGDDANPEMFRVTVTFEDLGAGRTQLTLRSIFPTAEARNVTVERYGAIEGGKQTLARLGEHLATWVRNEVHS